jgi:hypothetical protein
MEKITAYTQAFLSGDFFQHLDKHGDIAVTDNLQTTRIPALPVAGLDLQLLKQIYCHCVAHPSEFQTTVTGKLFETWYSQPRSAGWLENTIIENTEPCLFHSLHDQQHTVARPKSIVNNNKKLINLCTQVLEPLELSIQFLRIMKLSAGGWIRPHQDLKEIDHGLCYFWIPLHEFPACLKVFPFGWLQHQYGNMYLFNQGAYIHAVHNHTQQDRYVMLGQFDPNQVPASLLTYYNNNKHKFLGIWKSTN